MKNGHGGSPDFVRRIALVLANRRRAITGGLLLLVALCVLAGALRMRLASDILDLLPQRFGSVRTFKTFDREFSQARELTFGILAEQNPGDLDAFTEHFAEMLRAEPWVVRVMDQSPLETAAGLHDVPAMAAPLLLNLAPADFERAVAALEPGAIAERLKRLRTALEAGSPKAEFELEFDPLGLVAPALKPLAGSFATEQSRPLTSPDGTLRVVVAITGQPDLSARACQETMRRVEDLKRRAVAGWQGAGAAPEILVTGRTAYVGELSLKMRSDVLSTFGGSFLTVAAIFYLGFGRIRPLISLLHVLLLACVVSVAVGAIVFGELNMITIGLCAILVGLGEDFGMMLYAYYQQARTEGADHAGAIEAALRHHGRGVVFGALTTAAAFASLLLTECAGFMQLGVLIAVGILVAAALMMTVFFVFISRDPQPPRIDLVSAGGAWFVDRVMARPRAIFLATASLLVALAIYVFSPAGQLRFDAHPRSLEPRNSQAGHAMRTIQAKMPRATEPVFALVRGKDAADLHERWAQLDRAWSALVAEGKLAAVSTPAPFAISPERARANAAALAPEKIAAAREALSRALDAEGLSPEPFAAAFGLLDSLDAAARGDFALLDWRRVLPPASSWWFVLNHFFGNDPLVGIGYVTPVSRVDSFAAKEALRTLLTVPGVELHLSGWSYTLADLIPWVKGKALLLVTAMVGLNVAILLFLYRRIFPLLALLASLALSMIAMLATLKLCGVALNLFNTLAFALVLGVGVDYGIYVVLAMRAADVRRELRTIFKPVLLSGLTTVAGFGSLITAQNPALWSLGVVCATGVAWCLFTTFFFILPLYLWRGAR